MKRFFGHIRGTWKSVLATMLIFGILVWLFKLLRGDDLLTTIPGALAFGVVISVMWSYITYSNAKDLKRKLSAIDLSKLGEDMVLTDHYDGGQRVIEITGIYRSTKVKITHRINDDSKQQYLDFYVESESGSYEKATEVKVYERINREMLAVGLRNAVMVAKERKRLR